MKIKDKPSRNTRPESAKRHSFEKEAFSGSAHDRNAPKDQRFKDRWSQLNSDVHSALNYWNDLTSKYDGKISPDQEQLKEIKCLLKELQKKIKDFA